MHCIMKLSLSLAALAALLTSGSAAHAAGKTLNVVAGKTLTVRGDLKSGKRIGLGFATRSSIACFPTTQFKHFDGSHVFYKMRLPAKSKVTITVTPDAGTDVSLYAYSASGHPMPPRLYRVVSCEASYLRGENSRRVTSNPGKPEQVALRAIRNPYDVVIVVAGAKRATRGGYTLKVDLQTAAPGVPDTGPPPVKTITLKSNTTKTVRGDIRRGKKLPLEWATNPNVACFPTTRFQHFTGNHVVYKTRIPARSKMTITLKPGAGKDLSLYAYMASRHPLPPKLYRVVTCEASYLFGENRRSVTSNPGKPEKVTLRSIGRGYDVVIGVAGASKLTAGSFSIDIKLDTAAPGVADTGPPPAKTLVVKPNTTKKIRGDIRGGKILPLSFAKNPNVACFPTTRFQHFSGNHVAYKTRLPAKSTMTITLKPGAGKDLSLYAYSASGHPLPPKLYRVVSCEASYLYGENRRSVTSNPGKMEKVTLRAIRNPYDVVIVVVGANKLERGSFQLEVKLDTVVPDVVDTGPPPVKKLAIKSNTTKTVRGDIRTGKRIPLEWATSSNVACFPTTRFQHYTGKHVLYKTRLPARSKLTITVQPGAGKDLSLYAYAARGYPLPPKLYRARCEASYLYGEKSFRVKTNPGKPETVTLYAIGNGYDVVIGVAGAYKLERGSFKLTVKLDTAAPGVPDTGPPPVQTLNVKPNTTKTVRGDIRRGKILPLAWATNPNVACFPSTRFQYFNGNHVAYKTRLPAKSTMTITLKPGAGKDLNLYAYSAGGHPLPPKLYRAVSCEASYLYGNNRRSVTRNPGKIEKVTLRAIRNPYDVVIGVVGSNKLKSGSFTLDVKLDTAAPGVSDTGPPPTKTITAKMNRTVTTSGDIRGGKKLPLAWATNPNVACFPTTRNQHFDGNHVAFKTKMPRRSRMIVELIPAPGVDLSLYAYSASGHPLPPKLYRARCEASYLYGENRRSVTSNPGKPEKIELRGVNPYDVVIGVAGAGKATRGKFKLKVTLKPY